MFRFVHKKYAYIGSLYIVKLGQHTLRDSNLLCGDCAKPVLNFASFRVFPSAPYILAVHALTSLDERFAQSVHGWSVGALCGSKTSFKGGLVF